jgi:hypothetical protein
MQPVQVILANEPRLLRGMLSRAINHTVGLEVVGEITDLAELLSTVAKSGARWVIVSLWPPDRVPSEVEAILDKNPSICVLGIAADSSQVRIRCAQSPENVLEGPSLDDLLWTLRHPIAAAGNGTRPGQQQRQPNAVGGEGN